MFRVCSSAFVIVALLAGSAFGAQASAPRQDAAAAKAPVINLNTATAAELEQLPGIGAKVAARIVEQRKEKPFARPEDLMEVKGIGEKMFLTLKPYVTVSGPTTLTAKVRSSSSAARRSSPPAASKEKPASAVPVGKGR